MSLILRYVFKGIIKESFIAFIDCHDKAFSPDISNSNDYDDDSDDNIDVNLIIPEPKLTGEILGETSR